MDNQENVVVDYTVKFNGKSPEMEKLAKMFASTKKKEGIYETKLFKTETGFIVKCHYEYKDIELIDDKEEESK